jgi:hypothetical protein
VKRFVAAFLSVLVLVAPAMAILHCGACCDPGPAASTENKAPATDKATARRTAAAAPEKASCCKQKGTNRGDDGAMRFAGSEKSRARAAAAPAQRPWGRGDDCQCCGDNESRSGSAVGATVDAKASFSRLVEWAAAPKGSLVLVSAGNCAERRARAAELGGAHGHRVFVTLRC